jgi:hypothetical protein
MIGRAVCGRVTAVPNGRAWIGFGWQDRCPADRLLSGAESLFGDCVGSGGFVAFADQRGDVPQTAGGGALSRMTLTMFDDEGAQIVLLLRDRICRMPELRIGTPSWWYFVAAALGHENG